MIAVTAKAPVLHSVPIALAAGFIATIVFTLVAFYGGTAALGFPLDIAAALAAMLGDNAMLGSLAHYLAGTVAFPFGYLIARHVIPGSPWIKGGAWGVALWLGAMVVAAPMMGAGLFLSLAGTWLAPAVSLLAHLVYGVTLAGIFERTQ